MIVKQSFLKWMVRMCFGLLSVATVMADGNCKTVRAKAPSPMQPIRVFICPNRDFKITNFGAVLDGEVDNTKAIVTAINACNKAGGGHVVVPAGIWLTGPAHLKSNVNFCLEGGAVLSFTDNPEDHLPAATTSWEGLECYNYSPLLYVFECENVTISGKGTLQLKMGTRKVWFRRLALHLQVLKELYTRASINVPAIECQIIIDENHLRPYLVHFGRCKNAMLDEFKIRKNPFWTIHLYVYDGGIVRNLDVWVHGHNNDGIDSGMSRNFLVEDCSSDQGDDVAITKAGHNQDTWRLNTPCESIVIRNCRILKGHTSLSIGSEIPGGTRNIYMHDCIAPYPVMRLLFVKTNHRRGGFIENIYMKDVASEITQRVLKIDAEVLYQWRDLAPTYEKRIARIDGIYTDKVIRKSADATYELRGDAELPMKNVRVKDVKVGSVKKFVKRVSNVENVVGRNATYQTEDNKN